MNLECRVDILYIDLLLLACVQAFFFPGEGERKREGYKRKGKGLIAGYVITSCITYTINSTGLHYYCITLK